MTERVGNRVVCGLGLVVKVVDGSRTFTGKDARHPARLIAKAPCNVNYCSGYDHGTRENIVTGPTDSDTGAVAIVQTELNNIRIILRPTLVSYVRNLPANIARAIILTGYQAKWNWRYPGYSPAPAHPALSTPPRAPCRRIA